MKCSWRAEMFLQHFFKYRSSVALIAFEFPMIKTPGLEDSLCRAQDPKLTDAVLDQIFVLYLATYHASTTTTPPPYLLATGGSSSIWVHRRDPGSSDTVTVTLKPSEITLSVTPTRQSEDDLHYLGGAVTITNDDVAKRTVLNGLKPYIFDAIRTAIIEKTGSVQQFDANELAGFKLQMKESHDVRNPFFYDKDGELYVLWYTPPTGNPNPAKSGDCVNMQKLADFYAQNQDNKIGMSFASQNQRLVVDRLFESNLPVDRVQNQLLPIYEAAMQTLADSATSDGTSYAFEDDTFRANLCWMRRYLPRIYRELTRFIMYDSTHNEFKVEFSPPQVTAEVFSGDDDDAGGLRRYFVTKLIETTLSRNDFVQTDDVEFVAKSVVNLPPTSSFIEKSLTQLDANEKSVYDGLASLIYYNVRLAASGHSADAIDFTPLGPVFSSLFYEYSCCTSGLDKVLTVVNTYGQQYEKETLNYVMTASHSDVQEDDSRLVYVKTFLDEANPDFLPLDTTAFWNAENWEETKRLIVTFFGVLYRKYMLVFDTVDASLRRVTTKSHLYQIPWIHHPLDVYRFKANLRSDLRNITFQTAENANMESSREAPEGVSLLILAGILKYLGYGQPSSVISQYDETPPPSNPRKRKMEWKAKVHVESLRIVKFFPDYANHARFYYASDACLVVSVLAQGLRVRVEGRLDRQKIIDDMRIPDNLPNVRRWLEEMILNESQEYVERFLTIVTGSKRLIPGQTIRVRVGSPLYAHTCFKMLDVPLEVEHGTKDFFFAALM